MDLAVVASFVLTILLELVFPLLVAWYIVRRYQLSWRIFGYGVLFFVLVQVVHTPLVLLTQTPFAVALDTWIPNKTLSLAVFSVILGLLAGIFEEVGRYLIFSRFFPSRNLAISRENGLLFGAGWGGVESMIVGILVSLTLLSYIFAAPLTDTQLQEINASTGGTLTQEQLKAIQTQNQELLNLTPLDPLIGLLERLMTFPVQIAFTLLVLSSVVLGRPLLLGLAILWHTELDALAVFLASTSGIAAAEVLVALNAALALTYIWSRWPGRQHE